MPRTHAAWEGCVPDGDRIFWTRGALCIRMRDILAPLIAECYLQFKKPAPAKPCQCPFCNAHNYAVKYTGCLTKEEREAMEQVGVSTVLNMPGLPIGTYFGPVLSMTLERVTDVGRVT